MNRIPTFPFRPKNKMSILKNINTSRYGTGSNMIELVRAEDTDIKIDTIFIKPIGINSTDCVLRLFINNGKDFDNPLNNILYEEITVPLYNSSTSISNNYINELSLRLPSKYKLFGTLSRTLESGISVTINYTDY